MIVTINDGYEDSVAKEVKIRVHDVNEVPEFDKDSYSLTHDEGGVNIKYLMADGVIMTS